MQLNKENLKLGILKNLVNAQDLIYESQILLDNNKFARSYTLSHIAIEEASKCTMLYKVLAFQVTNEFIDISNVRKRYRNHKEKIQNFSLISKLFESYSHSNFTIDNYNKFKNSSLYVDWNNENEFILPSEAISEDLARKHFEIALNYVLFINNITQELINDEVGFEQKFEIYNKTILKPFVKHELERNKKKS